MGVHDKERVSPLTLHGFLGKYRLLCLSCTVELISHSKNWNYGLSFCPTFDKNTDSSVLQLQRNRSRILKKTAQNADQNNAILFWSVRNFTKRSIFNNSATKRPQNIQSSCLSLEIVGIQTKHTELSCKRREGLD